MKRTDEIKTAPFTNGWRYGKFTATTQYTKKIDPIRKIRTRIARGTS